MKTRMLSRSRTLLLPALAAGLCWPAALSAAELRLGQATAPPGAVVAIPVTCTGTDGAIAAQLDVRFDPAVVSVSGFVGDGGLAGHIVDQQLLSPGLWRGLIYSPTNGLIAPGTVAWISCTIAAGAASGAVPLHVTNAIVSEDAGQRVQPLSTADGLLTIVPPGGGFVSIGMDTAGQAHMQFLGVDGWHYALEASSDLTNWVPLTTNTAVGGLIEFDEAAGYPQRFYRARLVP